MRLYTKHGDSGYTTLSGGTHVAKDDVRICVGGDIDELNTFIGALLAEIPSTCGEAAMLLDVVQRKLFQIGSCMSSVSKTEQTAIALTDIEQLEQAIDHMQQVLPPLDTFVLPSGCRAATQSHVCRVVCRRLERTVVTLLHQYPVQSTILSYLNRLSDYFFVLALYLNFITGIAEKKVYITCK